MLSLLLTKQTHICMDSVTVTLSISAQEYARFYRGQARNVICTAKDGRTVQFPAAVLRQFLTHDGIYGDFSISFTSENRFKNIIRKS